MRYGAEELKRDLTNKVNSLEGKEKQEFLAQMATYHMKILDGGKDDVIVDSFITVLGQWIGEYFAPRNPDQTLNRPLFEERMGEYFDYCVEQQLEAGKYMENLGPHSAEWKQHYLFEVNPDAPTAYAVSDLSMALDNEKNVGSVIEEAYGGTKLPTVLSNQFNSRFRERLQTATFDEKRAMNKGKRLFQSALATNNAREKEIAKTEAPYDKSETNYERAFRKYADNLDFSFIQDKEVARNLRKGQGKHARSEIRSLSDQLGQMEDFLNSKENSRWRDSSHMKAVKKSLNKVRELIEIQGSGTPEKRAAIADAYQELQDSCSAYLEKRSGDRYTGVGNRRQRAVASLAEFLENNTVVRDMIEEDQRAAETRYEEKEAAKRGPVPGTEMAKLLVMSETGASFQEVQDPGAFREQKENALARIQQGMEQMGQDKSAMTDIVGKCTQALASIDVQTETLKAIGFDPESLTQGQKEIALKAPGNHDKINDFLYNLSSTVKAASGELHSQSLQELRSQMEQDGAWKGTFENGSRAEKAMTDGLESEVQWYKMRRDYEEGYEYVDIDAKLHFLSQEERAACKGAVNPGREQIAAGAFKWEMNVEKAGKEKQSEPEKMNFKDLSREFQEEHVKESPRRNSLQPEKHTQLEHHESFKARNSLGK